MNNNENGYRIMCEMQKSGLFTEDEINYAILKYNYNTYGHVGQYVQDLITVVKAYEDEKKPQLPVKEEVVQAERKPVDLIGARPASDVGVKSDVMKPKIAVDRPTMEDEQRKIEFERDFNDTDYEESRYDRSDPDSDASIDAEMRREGEGNSDYEESNEDNGREIGLKSLADELELSEGESGVNMGVIDEFPELLADEWAINELNDYLRNKGLYVTEDHGYLFLNRMGMEKAWKAFNKGLVERTVANTKPKKNVPGKIYNADNPKDADAFVNRMNTQKKKKV